MMEESAMSSSFGNNFRLQLFGQSHSRAIGFTIDTLPAGCVIDTQALERFTDRRAPGRNRFSTARKETDKPDFICGVLPDMNDPKRLITCGAPLTVIIRNDDTRSSDYSAVSDIPRPSHADYTAHIAYGGFEDVRGGGHFSGRLTAPLCAAGGICKQILEQKGIYIGAHIASIGDITDVRYDPAGVVKEDLIKTADGSFPVLDPDAGESMKALIEECRADLDSVGGVVECAIIGMPAGLGSPMFGSLESRISQAIFAIPAVKGIEFGSGFDGAAARASRNNDPFRIVDGRVVSVTNSHGGILGGISSGMPVIFRAAFKPTPSIAKRQESVSYSRGENASIEIVGRHDPCIVPRALPVVEAVAAIVVLDALLDADKCNN